MHKLEYNTQRGDIRLKEYGRTVQDLAMQVRAMTDPDERLEKAKSVIKLMKIINPGFKDNAENEQMMWDHLHIITDFGMDVENNGFEKPSPENITKKPSKVEYPAQSIRLKHYGKNIEKIILKLVSEEDEEKKWAGISKIGKMMKKFYAEFNTDLLEDDVISSQIEDISRGKLKIDRSKVLEEGLFYVSKAELLTDNHNFKKKTTNNNQKQNNNNNKHKQKNRK
jgi:hypothetical protein